MTGSATYSPEDNKLRIYPSSRLSKELYERVRASGFIWAPKAGTIRRAYVDAGAGRPCN